MDSAITISSSADFRGMRLEKTVNDHVVSPWWTFPWRQAGVTAPQQFNSRYHEISRASIFAFSDLLGIQPSDVLVTEKIVDGERWWRLGTKNPCELPETKPEKRPTLKDAGPPAIDI